MGRPKKVVAKDEASPANNSKNNLSTEDESLVLSRSRRTIKPNPKYNSKEILQLPRSRSSSDEEEGAGDNTEEDEDFNEDDDKDDSDMEKLLPRRGRGRPPKSEPTAVVSKRMVPLRAAVSSAVRANTQKTGATNNVIMTAGMRKRKIDFDESDTGVVSTTISPLNRASTRTTANTAANQEKENNSTASGILIRHSAQINNVPKKAANDDTFTIVNINEIFDKKQEMILRKRKPDEQHPEPAQKRKLDDSPKSIIQVRRSTPMNNNVISGQGTATVKKPVAIAPVPTTTTPGLGLRGTRQTITTTPIAADSKTKQTPLADTVWSIKMPAEKITPDRPVTRCSLNLTKFGNELRYFTMPNSRWSFQIKLVKAPPNYSGIKQEHYKGEVNDPNTMEGEEYDVHTIILRRQSMKNGTMPRPTSACQYDRTVELRNRGGFALAVEEKAVRLIAAPLQLNSKDELKTLLEIVDEISPQSPLIEKLRV